MKVKLRGHLNRRAKILPIWLEMKKMYDSGASVNDIIKKIKRPKGGHYTRPYVYQVFKKLEKITI